MLLFAVKDQDNLIKMLLLEMIFVNYIDNLWFEKLFFINIHFVQPSRSRHE